MTECGGVVAATATAEGQRAPVTERVRGLVGPPSFEACCYYATDTMISCSSNFHCRRRRMAWRHFARPYGSAFYGLFTTQRLRYFRHQLAVIILPIWVPPQQN